MVGLDWLDGESVAGLGGRDSIKEVESDESDDDRCRDRQGCKYPGWRNRLQADKYRCEACEQDEPGGFKNGNHGDGDDPGPARTSQSHG